MNRLMTNKYFKGLVMIAVMLMMNMVASAFGADGDLTFTEMAKTIGKDLQGGVAMIAGIIMLVACVWNMFRSGFTLQSILIAAVCFVLAYLIYSGIYAKVKIV